MKYDRRFFLLFFAGLLISGITIAGEKESTSAKLLKICRRLAGNLASQVWQAAPLPSHDVDHGSTTFLKSFEEGQTLSTRHGRLTFYKDVGGAKMLWLEPADKADLDGTIERVRAELKEISPDIHVLKGTNRAQIIYPHQGTSEREVNQKFEKILRYLMQPAGQGPSWFLISFTEGQSLTTRHGSLTFYKDVGGATMLWLEPEEKTDLDGTIEQVRAELKKISPDIQVVKGTNRAQIIYPHQGTSQREVNQNLERLLKSLLK